QGNPTAYPVKKAKKITPIKSTYFLLLRNQKNHILLEQRPSYGIWGGLWSFPECDTNTDIKNYITDHFDFNLMKVEELKLMTHKFSHYTLQIQPILIDITENNKRVMESQSQVWYNLTHSLP